MRENQADFLSWVNTHRVGLPVATGVGALQIADELEHFDPYWLGIRNIGQTKLSQGCAGR
jgi:hypothetical protein